MVPLTRREAVAGLATSAAARPGPSTGAEPRRIVSLNPCLDAILVQVADRAQIIALSHYSHDPVSSSSGALGLTFPFTHERAEEIVMLAPDLLLTAGPSALATRAALARMQVRSEVFGLPGSVAQSCRQVTRVATLVHRPERGTALVARIEAALAAATPPPGSPRLSALVFEAGGFVSAKGTMMDEMLTRAGFDNAATRYGLTHTGDVPLERLIADPPQVLLAGTPDPGAPTWADRIIAHPALRAVAPRMYRASFPQTLTFCGGPVLIDCAAMLAKAYREGIAFHRLSGHPAGAKT